MRTHEEFPQATFYRDSQNLIFASKELYDLFYENEFAIDPDVRASPSYAGTLRSLANYEAQDDYRIYSFTQRARDKKLPETAPDILKLYGAERFLREQLRWCIILHFFGGDNSEKYDEDDIRAFAARAGFYPGTRPRIRFTDKKWKTAIGKGFIPWVTETDGEDDTDESENESEDE